MQLEEGVLFDNRYLLKRLLGSGGFSEVWLVEDTKVDNQKRALKVYAPGKGLDEDGIQLFSSEFQLVYDLNHSHLLRPSHFDDFQRSPYLILPYCERGSATNLTGVITEDEAWRFLHDVASGLAYLHEQIEPVVHQDIKPDNVLLDLHGNYLITDFGISAKARSTLRRSVGKATSGGTIAYMAPERFGKDKTPVKASDIWALGATMFELMTGDVPFGEHGGALQKSGAEIPEITKDYSQRLKNIVCKMLACEPWDRPTAKQLTEWANHKGMVEPPPPVEFHTRKHTVLPPQPPSQKNRVVYWVIGAVVVTFIVTVIALAVIGFLLDEDAMPFFPYEISNLSDEQEAASILKKGAWHDLLKKAISNHPKHSWDDGSKYKGMDRAFGLGVYLWGGGDIYFGFFTENVQYGYGVYMIAPGSSDIIYNCRDCKYYVGDWSNGKMNGKGTCYDSNGKLIYYGEFKDNKPQETYPTSGDYSSYRFGVIEYSTGKYIGETKDGKNDGYGIFVWDDGNMWFGMWEDGIRNGSGIEIMINGDCKPE